jgi:RNA recognition motif-containing protein
MTIFVGNLAFDITEPDLMRLFSSFGEVSSVRIMNDKYIGSGRTCEYGYVEMPCSDESEAAIEALDGKILRQRKLSVVGARPLSPSIKSTARTKTRERP